VTQITGLHATLIWEPYVYIGDGFKLDAYRRLDGMGYVIPCCDRDGNLNGYWWTCWAHPMLFGKPGWAHHAFGQYSDATAAAMAFDKVYDLERIAGNVDRCPELKQS